ncbi:MAG: class I SAM-dependent methyltransferase [Clostridiales bacterium]|nr:class I SAM-dependent methyltransferase [Clostridiales bacterium]
MWIADNWIDYELIDAGNGKKLERWGDRILLRPDPQAVWQPSGTSEYWTKIDAVYNRSSKGGGEWNFQHKIPKRWTIKYNDLKFYVGTMGFKHTGLFPEQAVNWDWMTNIIKAQKEDVEVLNLFAYTGGATAACAKAGAFVTHVDASRGMVSWAKDNIEISGLNASPTRYIVDDCVKFVEREARRQKKYKGIIMDPPSYGRGPKGEAWKIEDMIYDHVKDCVEVLEEKPLFFLINSYTTGLSPAVMSNIVSLTVKSKFGGNIESNEIGLPISSSGLVLPCGTSCRWS